MDRDTDEMNRLMLEFTFGQRLVLLHDALAELRRVEWVTSNRVTYCQVCEHAREDGHAPDCTLATILARAAPPPGTAE